MKKLKIWLVIIILLVHINGRGQYLESYKLKGEIGAGVGFAHYFGDLTQGMPIQKLRPKFAASMYYKVQFNDHWGLRVGVEYARLGFSDAYADSIKQPTQYIRNLSFNNNTWNINTQVIFDFFKYKPGFRDYFFTPYIGLGVGILFTDPFAYLDGKKYYLRPLGTEGQASIFSPDKQYYSSTAFFVPITLGIKFSLSERINVFGEISYRFTNTDYLDDVSTTYSPISFVRYIDGAPNPAYILQDRSYVYGERVGTQFKQRGSSTKKDHFATFQIGISYNLNAYVCPSNF